jgi:hypothetical protein
MTSPKSHIFKFRTTNHYDQIPVSQIMKMRADTVAQVVILRANKWTAIVDGQKSTCIAIYKFRPKNSKIIVSCCFGF